MGQLLIPAPVGAEQSVSVQQDRAFASALWRDPKVLSFYSLHCNQYGIDPEPPHVKGSALEVYRLTAMIGVFRQSLVEHILETGQWSEIDVRRFAARAGCLMSFVGSAFKSGIMEPWARWRAQNGFGGLNADTGYRAWTSTSPLELECHATALVNHALSLRVRDPQLVDWRSRFVGLDSPREIGARVKAMAQDFGSLPSPTRTAQAALADLAVASERLTGPSIQPSDIFAASRLRAVGRQGYTEIKSALATMQAVVTKHEAAFEAECEGHTILVTATCPASTNTADRITLTPPDVEILRALARIYPTTICQEDLAADPDLELSRRTLGPRLKQLREWGLVERPRGYRQGDIITSLGLALLKKLPTNCP